MDCQSRNGSTLSARDAFLATGKHDLRGWKRPPGRQNDLVAFKMHWRVSAAQTAALAASIELFLFPGGYAGLELVESGIANLCLVVRRRHLALLDNRWDLLLSTLRSDFLTLHQRLAGAQACWDRPLAVASIPYGYVRSRGIGPWCLGDQAAVISSFSGDGIAIALHSARLAAECSLAGQTSSQFQSRPSRATSPARSQGDAAVSAARATRGADLGSGAGATRATTRRPYRPPHPNSEPPPDKHGATLRGGDQYAPRADGLKSPIPAGRAAAATAGWYRRATDRAGQPRIN